MQKGGVLLDVNPHLLYFLQLSERHDLLYLVLSLFSVALVLHIYDFGPLQRLLIIERSLQLYFVYVELSLSLCLYVF